MGEWEVGAGRWTCLGRRCFLRGGRAGAAQQRPESSPQAVKLQIRRRRKTVESRRTMLRLNLSAVAQADILARSLRSRYHLRRPVQFASPPRLNVPPTAFIHLLNHWTLIQGSASMVSPKRRRSDSSQPLLPPPEPVSPPAQLDAYPFWSLRSVQRLRWRWIVTALLLLSLLMGLSGWWGRRVRPSWIDSERFTQVRLRHQGFPFRLSLSDMCPLSLAFSWDHTLRTSQQETRRIIAYRKGSKWIRSP